MKITSGYRKERPIKPLFRILIAITATILSVSVFLASCRKPEAEKKEEKPAEIHGYHQAMVTFLSGEAFILRSGNWEPVEIGDLIVKEDTIRVADDSYCEIQFGNTAAVRIQEDTVVAMWAIFIKPGEADIGLKVAAGSVLFKVGKLVGDEKFNVESTATILGVRGTQFMVRAEEERSTLLAVKEGKISLLPALVDVDRLRDKLKGRGEEVLELIKQLVETAPIVGADQEITVERETLKEAELAFKEVEDLIDEIIKEEEAEVSPENLKMLDQKIKMVVKTLSAGLGLPDVLSEENRKELKKIEKIRMLKIFAAEQEELPVLVKIGVRTKPGDAYIFLNGDSVGSGSISGIFTQGDQLSFLIRQEGYEQETLNITAQTGGDEVYEVVLKEEAAIKPPEEIGINTVPPDSEILLNGEPVGRGNFTGQFSPGEKLIFSVRREGYREEILEVNVARGEGKIYEITLEAKPVIIKYSISDTAVTGNISTRGKNIFTVDGRGIVTSSDLQGNIYQTIPTGESPNQDSSPVLIGDRICFLGSTVFLVADINSGEVLMSSPVGESSSYPLGRSVAEFNNNLLFPDNESLKVYDLSTGKIIQVIKIPDGSTMTPVVYDNWILMVSKKGVLYIFDEKGEALSGIPITINPAFRDAPIASKVCGNLAFFAESGGTIICYNIEESRILWEKKFLLDREITGLRDFECGDQGVYAVSGGVLFALSVESGNTLFEPLSGVSSPPLYYEGHLYFGTEDGRINIANARTGDIMKSHNVGEKITARPQIIDGKILVGTESGHIVVLNPEGMR